MACRRYRDCRKFLAGAIQLTLDATAAHVASIRQVDDCGSPCYKTAGYESQSLALSSGISWKRTGPFSE